MFIGLVPGIQSHFHSSLRDQKYSDVLFSSSSHLLACQKLSRREQHFFCSRPSDLKLHLQSTDYGSFLANEASPLTVSVIDDKLKEKMVVEFRHMRNQSYEPLASFMDFITWGISADFFKMVVASLRQNRMMNMQCGAAQSINACLKCARGPSESAMQVWTAHSKPCFTIWPNIASFSYYIFY